MARLAQYVRGTLGAQNLFWIEGPDISSSFAGMISQGARLTVSGVVYSVHDLAGPHDAPSWNADFGYVYQLQPGYLIKSYRDMTVPTTITARTWSCRPSLEPQPGQGAGSLVLAWFRQQNGSPA